MASHIPPNFRLVYDAEQINKRIQALANEIIPWVDETERKTGKQPLAICILRGGVFFFADLLRAIPRSIELSFCRTWGYSSDTNAQTKAGIRVAVDEVEANKRAILMIDDISDTGATLKKLHNVFTNLGAVEVQSVVFVHRIVPDPSYLPTWSGFRFEGDEWFVGYGMDDVNHYSNLSSTYIIEDKK